MASGASEAFHATGLSPRSPRLREGNARLRTDNSGSPLDSRFFGCSLPDSTTSFAGGGRTYTHIQLCCDWAVGLVFASPSCCRSSSAFVQGLPNGARFLARVPVNDFAGAFSRVDGFEPVRNGAGAHCARGPVWAAGQKRLYNNNGFKL